MLKYLQVFSWLCEILLLLADSSSCFFSILYFLQIASVHDFWMDETYSTVFTNCSIEALRYIHFWLNISVLSPEKITFFYVPPWGSKDRPLIEEKCEENWAQVLMALYLLWSAWGLPQFWNERLADHWWLCSWKMHRILALKKWWYDIRCNAFFLEYSFFSTFWWRNVKLDGMHSSIFGFKIEIV